MLRAILNKSWRQHPTRHQLYGHLPPITKTVQVRRTRHAGHCWRSRDELINDVLEHTYSSYLRIRDVALKTCQRRWTIGRSGERGSGISMLAAHDDDDDVCISKSPQIFWVLFSSYCAKSTNHNWYNRHFHVPQLFQFSSKVEILILLFIFFQFYSVVSWDSKVDNFASSLFLVNYYKVWSSGRG